MTLNGTESNWRGDDIAMITNGRVDFSLLPFSSLSPLFLLSLSSLCPLFLLALPPEYLSRPVSIERGGN